MKIKGNHNMLQAHQQGFSSHTFCFLRLSQTSCSNASMLGMPDSSEMKSNRLQPYCEPSQLHNLQLLTRLACTQNRLHVLMKVQQFAMQLTKPRNYRICYTNETARTWLLSDWNESPQSKHGATIDNVNLRQCKTDWSNIQLIAFTATIRTMNTWICICKSDFHPAQISQHFPWSSLYHYCCKSASPISSTHSANFLGSLCFVTEVRHK